MRSNHFFSRNSQSGMTLLETVLAVGLMGVVIAVGVKSLSYSSHLQKHLEVKGEIEDIRDLIRASLDCNATVASQTAQCDSSRYIQVKKSDNTTFINTPAHPTIFGDSVEVRSKCVPGDCIYKLNMDYRRTHNGRVLRNHLTGKNYDWEDLFPNVPITCPRPSCDAGQLIFTFQLPKTASRSRELFSQLCTNHAQSQGKSGTFKALISLTSQFALHPQDVGQPLNAVDYINIRGKVTNKAGQTVAKNRQEFWSEIHTADITKLDGSIPPIAHSTGSTARGRYPTTCATRDVGGFRQTCNCQNLQRADNGGNSDYRFASGYPDIATYNKPLVNWAFSMVYDNGQTICTFNDNNHNPTVIYCIQD